jgi:acetyl/propionyl-CoA carboxylase alpha subunit
MKIKKLFIANRGEIVCRIARTASRMGIRTSGVYTPQDSVNFPVRLLDESAPLPSGDLSENYLNQELLIAKARQFGAQAVHPGYGFLSENPEFAQKVHQAGLIWMGPPPKAMIDLGGKIRAKEIATKARVPVLPWRKIGGNPSPQEAERILQDIGLPVLIKAAHGGGGRGQRVVSDPQEFTDALIAARSEAMRSFGSTEVFVERFVERPRHIEVQIISDHHGNYFALGERDCTLQRRNQKVIEETPAEQLDPETRQSIHDAAIALARSVGYTNAGTIEFLVQKTATGAWEFFFMELNARLQVEHTVTEQVWNVDLVELQIRISQDENMKKQFGSLSGPSGHAIEVRLCAENPENHFLPRPGPIVDFLIPQSENLRVDSGYEAGDVVPQEYDSLVAKFIYRSANREQTIQGLVSVLDQSIVSGVFNNKFFLRDLLSHPDFHSDQIYTQWIENHPELTAQVPSTLDDDLGYWGRKWSSELFVQRRISNSQINFKNNQIHGPKLLLHFQPEEGVHGSTSRQGLVKIGGTFELADGRKVFAAGWINRFELFITFMREIEHVGQRRIHFLGQFETEDTKTYHGPIVAQVPGVVLDIRVALHDVVEARSPILIIEAMKIEMPMSLPVLARITGINVKPGDRIQPGQTLVTWEPVV